MLGMLLNWLKISALQIYLLTQVHPCFVKIQVICDYCKFRIFRQFIINSALQICQYYKIKYLQLDPNKKSAMQPDSTDNNTLTLSAYSNFPAYLQHPSLCVLTSYENQILICLHKMINADGSEQAEQYLRKLYDSDGLTFIDALFALILKSSVSKSIQFREAQQNINFTLLYLRHFIHQQKSRLPDITLRLVTTYTVLFPSQHRPLLVDCFKVYLVKYNHSIYAKQFLQSISFQILQSLRSDSVREDHLMLMVEVFEGLVYSKQFRPGLSPQAQRVTNIIVNQFCEKRPHNIRQSLWTWMIIVLSNFTRFTPTNAFILSQISNNSPEMPMKSRIQIFAMYVRVHDRFRNLEDMYLLLRLQLQRIGNSQFMQALDEEGGVDAAQTLLSTIRHLIKDTLSLIRQNSNEADINLQMLIGYFKSYEMWSNVILNCVRMMERYENEQIVMNVLMVQIIKQLSQFIDQPEELRDFIIKIKDKLKQQYLFCLLAGMPKFIMNVFQADTILVNHCATLPITVGKEIRGINCNMFLLEVFLKFMIRYLNVSRYIEDELIEKSIRPFWEYIIELTIRDYDDKHDDHEVDKYNSNIIKLRAYGISILTRLLKYEPDPARYNATIVLEEYYYAFMAAHKIGGDDQSETTAIILDSITEICAIKAYRKMLYDCVICFFNQLLFVEQDIQQPLRIFMCSQFLKVLQECFDFQVFINDSQNRLFGIFSKCMMSSNKSLQDQVCEFTLKILCQLNTYLNKNQITLQKAQHILSNIYNTKVYDYIKNCLIKQDDDPLYCKILMQTLLHENGKKLVEQILIEACSTPHALTTVLKTDQVWQAMVILYDVENEYTEKKMINKKVSEIKENDLESLMQKMNIDEQNEYKQKTKTNRKRVHWAWLPEVRKVVEQGSVAGVIVDKKLNENN